MRWIKINIKGNCLVPQIHPNKTIDARVDFDFEEIEVGDFVTYLYGLRYNIKRVLGKDKFSLTENKVIVANEAIEINNKSFMCLEGYSEKNWPDCILVGSYLKPDPWVRIVHKDNIKYLIKKIDL